MLEIPNLGLSGTASSADDLPPRGVAQNPSVERPFETVRELLGQDVACSADLERAFSESRLRVMSPA